MSNEPTIAEMNRAICEFMGWEFKEVDPDWYEAFHDGQLQWADEKKFIDRIMLEGFRFHEDWVKLMEVIDKISKMPLLNWDNTICADPQDVCYPRTFGMPTEDGKSVMVRLNGFSLHTAPTLIEAAHMAVYEAAEYHSKQQSNEQR